MIAALAACTMAACAEHAPAAPPRAQLSAPAAETRAQDGGESSLAEASADFARSYAPQAESPAAGEAALQPLHSWESVPMEGTGGEEAPFDGSLGKWAPGHYAAHDWSECGQAISALAPGDAVEVDGELLVAESATVFPADATAGEVRRQLGDDPVLLQTCSGEQHVVVVACRREPAGGKGR